MIHTKQLVSLLVIILVGLGGYYYLENQSERVSLRIPLHGEQSTLSMGDTKIQIEIVGTIKSKQTGLSGRDRLPLNHGMFFLFPRDDFHGIWMKDMLFPIDIVWIDKDLTIVTIAESATPGSYPQVFKPSQVSRYVLELSSGFIREHKIKIGEKVYFMDMD